MDIIRIKKLRLRCLIGFNPHELKDKQDVVISIDLYTDLRKGGASDNPDDILNYRTINKAVIKHVEESRYKTLEALATGIAKVAIVDCAAPHVKVIVEKPNALRFTDNVMVVIERKTEDFEAN
jgi:FolB domain-containing protein